MHTPDVTFSFSVNSCIVTLTSPPDSVMSILEVLKIRKKGRVANEKQKIIFYRPLSLSDSP